MGSPDAVAGRAAPPPRRWVVDRRLMGLAIAIEVVALCMAYMVVYVPVLGPKLTRQEANQHWPEAAIAALVVSIGVVLVVVTALHRRRTSPLPDVEHAGPDEALPRLPRSLRFERVPAAWVRGAAAFSLSTIPASVVLGAHLWQAWLAILAPWVPIVAIEAKHKSRRDLVFVAFGLLVILQLLHMVEHTTQVAQLLATHGSLRRSHGVIGQLDFELVHFVADTTLWVSVGLLAISFKGRNTWLWVAFAATSMHQVEHFFLYWLNTFENTVYLSGGAAGIMGKHGLVGSPLDRPYLHYSYNFIVIAPLLIAFWDEARHMDRLHPLRPSAAAEPARRAPPRSTASSEPDEALPAQSGAAPAHLVP